MPAASSEDGAYVCTCQVAEHHRQPIYCVAFNTIDRRHQDVFATVGSNQATVYRLKGSELEVLQVYVDEQAEESFYTCRFSIDEDSGAALLLLAGANRIVRVVNLHTAAAVQALAGHGKAINDLAVIPSKPRFVFSASKDESVRLWNVRAGICVAVFSSHLAHQNEVLTLDVNSMNERFLVSGGMDNRINIWCLHGLDFAMTASDGTQGGGKGFKTALVQVPCFSTTAVHGNYVDCVRWFGNHVLSKSVDNRILLWAPNPSLPVLAEELEKDRMHGSFPAEPGPHPPPPLQTHHRFNVIQELALPSADLWFLRFSLDPEFRTLACGNRRGQVFVYRLRPGVGQALKLQVPRPRGGKGGPLIRQTALSWDASVVLASAEDGSIWRWDLASSAKA